MFEFFGRCGAANFFPTNVLLRAAALSAIAPITGSGRQGLSTGSRCRRFQPLPPTPPAISAAASIANGVAT
ncbi:hypothetical protein CHX27_04855 [Flavobacterium aurantiibacter]|uniref:Uncharacterized protein n=1 Tax=Flavobacterium aurantiibacter TaxID=2023067 RepID=A0A255ZXE4_9FLAO|nr:hypothetical protein CHX27_04855 [Flavobacterium aurantiibacter]